MVNKLRGEARFNHDGQEMRIVFDTAAWLAIEDRLDMGMYALLDHLSAAERDARQVKVGTLATILQCGLARHHPDITREAAADMIMTNSGLQAALGTAIRVSHPTAGDPGAARPGKPVTRKANPSPAKNPRPNGTGRKR